MTETVYGRPISGLQMTNSYQHYTFDLDDSLDRMGIDRSEEVRLRFAQWGGNSIAYLDNIRISNVDVFGPSVVSSSEIEQALPPISSFEFTFDEEVDPNSITPESVTLNGPIGNGISNRFHHFNRQPNV